LSRRWQEPAPRQDRPLLNADVRMIMVLIEPQIDFDWGQDE
jgi:hypothetical protein